MKTSTMLAIGVALIGGAVLVSKGSSGDVDEPDDDDGDVDEPDDDDGDGDVDEPGPGFQGFDPDSGNSTRLDTGGLTFDDDGMVYDTEGQPVAASVSGKKVLFPTPERVEKEKIGPFGDYICENNQPLQQQSIDLSMGEDLNAAWQPFYSWCVAFIAQGNDYGVTPGFYAVLQQYEKERKYVFGPFTNIKEVPGGRPEVNVEDTLRKLLQHGTNYAKAREVKS